MDKKTEETAKETVDKKELEILKIKARILDLITHQQQFNNQVNSEVAALQQQLAALLK